MNKFFKSSNNPGVDNLKKAEKEKEPKQELEQQEQEQQELELGLKLEQEEQEKMEYNEFRNAYKRHEYIPSDKINVAFSYNFQHSSIICSANENIKICNIKLSSLLNAHVINWEYNRDPDVVRIPEIAKYIYESKARIQTMFYLNYNFKHDRFEIIDGIHRYCALKMLKSLYDEDGLIIDDRLRNENGDNITSWFNPGENIDWLLNSEVIVQINFKSTYNELIILRDDINHSQPMPILVRPSLDIEKNGIINRIADDYIHKYKKCFGTSSDETYLRNNRKTSRDKFIVLLSKMYDKYNINAERIGTLQQRLEIANDKIRSELLENKIKCNETIKNRCRETRCYLFLYKDCDLEELI